MWVIPGHQACALGNSTSCEIAIVIAAEHVNTILKLQWLAGIELLEYWKFGFVELRCF